MSGRSLVALNEDLEECLLCLLLHKSRDEVRAMAPLDRDQVLQTNRARVDLENEAIERRRASSSPSMAPPRTYPVD